MTSSIRRYALLLAGFAECLVQAGAALDGQLSHYARQGTNRVHYLSSGSGDQAVVFVHGWAGRLEHWEAQFAALQGMTRVLLVDLPGHGRSDVPAEPCTMPFLAGGIRSVLEDAGVKRAALVGFSMGVPVICRFYRDYPEKVLALVAVDGALRRFPMTGEQREAFLAPYRSQEFRKSAQQFIAAMFPNPGTELLRDQVLEAVGRTPQEVMITAFEGMFDAASWEPLQVSVPLQLILARNPYWNEAYEAEIRRLRPDVDYSVLTGPGHFVMMERPAEVNGLLMSFLEQRRLLGIPGPSKANRLAPAERAAGWRQLFDGRTMAGWRGYRKAGFPEQGWTVEEGTIHKLPRLSGGDLVTVETFEDFEFSWEWRLASGGNNGIKYMVTEERPSAPGHEYQMVDDERHPDASRGPKRRTAAFYDVLAAATGGALRPAGEWNLSSVLVRGNVVEHWLNERKVLEYELGSDPLKGAITGSKFKDAPGFGAKIRGRLMLTDHRDECWFRNLKIRELGRP